MLALWSVFIDLIANKKSWQESRMYFIFLERGYFCSTACYLNGTSVSCERVTLKPWCQSSSLVQNLQMRLWQIPPRASPLKSVPFPVP